MVTSQEVIERTMYASIMQVALQLGLTLNPDNYLPLSKENQAMFDHDRLGLNKYVYIFGVGNNQVRGPKIVPRITIDLNAYYPGDIGVEQFMIGDEKVNQEYVMYQYPFETKHSQFDVHLVANNSEDLRLLHSIMYTALPARGYVKPFLERNLREYVNNPGLLKTGNIYTEIGNFYDHNDQEHGLLEKVYSYICVDGMIEENIPQDSTFAPIKDISALIKLDGSESSVSLHIKE